MDATSLRILAADDELSILGLYQEILGSFNSNRGPGIRQEQRMALPSGGGSDGGDGKDFELVLCPQGDEAVDEVRSAVETNRPFAAAFLDVRMPPGPDGIWAAERIRRLDPFINIVIVTGYTDIEALDIAQRVPPADKLLYVQKPFHLHEIRQFATALTAKWSLEKRMGGVLSHLEHEVEEKDGKLEELNLELKKANKVLESLSLIDDLTRLYNKRYFNQRLSEWVVYSRRYKTPLSLILFDIDNFKDYNDTHGHKEGDRLLERVGVIVQNSLRRQIDSAFTGVESLCRFGGEQFAIILPRTDTEGARIVAERIRLQMFEETTVTISVGVAEYAGEDDKGENMVRRADLLLCDAKSQGKNRVCW